MEEGKQDVDISKEVAAAVFCDRAAGGRGVKREGEREGGRGQEKQ